MQSTLYNLPQNLFVENLLFFRSYKDFCLFDSTFMVSLSVCLFVQSPNVVLYLPVSKAADCIYLICPSSLFKQAFVDYSFFFYPICSNFNKNKKCLCLIISIFFSQKTHVLLVLPFRCNLYSKPQNALLIFIQLILV